MELKIVLKYTHKSGRQRNRSQRVQEYKDVIMMEIGNIEEGGYIR